MACFQHEDTHVAHLSPTLDIIHEKSEKINSKHKIFSLFHMDFSEHGPLYNIRLHITIRFLFRNENEVQNEYYAQCRHHRMYLFSSASHDHGDRIEVEADCNPCRDAICQGHHEHGQERRHCHFELIPSDFGQIGHHQGADNDERWSSHF